VAHLVLYDGVCGLCDRINRFILAHDAHEQFHFASLQSAVARERLGRFGIETDALSTVYVLPDYERSQSPPVGRAAAALFVANALGWPWKIAAVLRVVPMSWLDRAYDAVARRRYRLFGRFEHCPLPAPGSFAASDMRSRSQGGSHTTSTLTPLTPGTSATRLRTSTGRVCAAGQAGAVSVMRMPTVFDASTTIS
jgi:predicted DCC family thiol-disulfide oxidoreductase YuxK